MKTLVLTLLIASWAAVCHAGLEEHFCRQPTHLPPSGDDTDGLRYVRSREIDILHLSLDVTPDFQQQAVSGKVTLRFKPIGKPFEELRLDGIDLTVKSVSSSEKLLAWQVTDSEIILTFEQPVPPEREASVVIDYHARPQKGLYFRTAEMGYKAEDTHLWTQGETIEARHWFPCFDSPNEKFTCDITCRVPQDMVVLSNGKLVSQEKDPGSDLMSVRWLQDKPMANYLIFLAAGYFKKIEDTYRDIPLAFYTPASQIHLSSNSFAGTKEMMAFFERETGVQYPWAKYDQVCVADFTVGGMENTSITCLNDRTLHPPEFENLRQSEGLVAHELAHQWFGDLVTCKDWANTWLNEGFATFYEHLYHGHAHGRDHELIRFYQSARHILEQPNQTNAIVRRTYRDPNDMFDYLAYPKGAWVLQMLRSQLGPELFRQCVKTYLERFQYKHVVTEDFQAVLEELSGLSLDQFFDQWVYHAGYPELSVAYNWDARTRLAKISVQQVQKLSRDVLLFNLSLPVRFKFKDHQPVDKTLSVNSQSEDFYVPLPAAPEIIRFDPAMTLLAKINFTPSRQMLDAQLSDSTDALGRLIACEQLSGKKEALPDFKKLLQTDPLHSIRISASQGLHAIHTPEALEALIASTRQPDARVRKQVVTDISGFYDEKVCQVGLKLLSADSNPDVKAAALSTLSPCEGAEIRETLLQALDSVSFRNVVADAAIQVMRLKDDPAFIQPIHETLRDKETHFTTVGLGKGLQAVAWLARNSENKAQLREFLLHHLKSPKSRLRLAAINSLGVLGDMKALAVLETFASADKASPERNAAEKAVAALRELKPPSAELGTLRGELLKLQNEGRTLRKEVDNLNKKLDALAPQPAQKNGRPVVKSPRDAKP